MRAQHSRSEHKAITPRMLTRGDAAAYCSIKPGTFDHWVSHGRLPRPLPGTKRWDKLAIDAALDRLSGIGPVSAKSDDDGFQRWLEENGHAR